MIFFGVPKFSSFLSGVSFAGRESARRADSTGRKYAPLQNIYKSLNGEYDMYVFDRTCKARVKLAGDLKKQANTGFQI